MILARIFEAVSGMILDVLNGIDDALCDQFEDEEDSLYDQNYQG